MDNAVIEAEFGETNWNGNEMKITVQRGDKKRVHEMYNESPSYGRLCRIVNSYPWHISATQDGWQAYRRNDETH